MITVFAVIGLGYVLNLLVLLGERIYYRNDQKIDREASLIFALPFLMIPYLLFGMLVFFIIANAGKGIKKWWRKRRIN